MTPFFPKLKILSGNQIPRLLREIPDPPEKLFLIGSLPSEHHTLLAVVGSRVHTSYGKSVCETLLHGLSGYPISIVSGLALGIDGIAHKAALKARLHTVAVPGSGLDVSVLYPKTHHALARSIVASGGAILSEYEPHVQAAPWTFPKRNRIMAGLSHGVLIVEASEKSGTLITARLAVEYNRELLVVPGSIFSQNSVGSHQFLKLGATPVTCAHDIIEALGIPTHEHHSAPHTLTEDEATVVRALTAPLSYDTLLELVPLPPERTLALITTLELRGIIVRDGAMLFVRPP